MQDLERKILPVSVWLLPKVDEGKGLASLINRLAQENGASPFNPHVTLYATTVPVDEFSKVEETLRMIAGNFKPFTTRVSGVQYSEAYFKALFINLVMTPEFARLAQQTRENLGRFGEYALDPHLSLLYKQGLSKQQKEEIKRQLVVPESIIIDRIALKVSGPDDNFGQDISKWRYTILN